MTKTELVAAMAENAELTKKDSDKVLNAFISIVTNELKNAIRSLLIIMESWWLCPGGGM